MNDPEPLDPKEAEDFFDGSGIEKKTRNQTKEEPISYLFLPKVCAGLLLFVAMAELPYGYYIFLRWAVCAVAVFSAYDHFERDQYGWGWGFAFVAFVFNPIAPVHMSRAIWLLFDIGTGCLMFVSAAKKMQKKNN